MEKIKAGSLTLSPNTAGKSTAYFCDTPFVEINGDVLQALKDLHRKSGEPQIRLNLHKNTSDTLQEMLIVQSRSGVYPAHKHISKDESYQIIEGALCVEIFDENGTAIKKAELSSSDKETAFLFRVEKNQWHRTTPQTDVVIFKESRPGPFEGGDSVEPAWSESKDE
jgi:cupin fold WbuC family metalloprotein